MASIATTPSYADLINAKPVIPGLGSSSSGSKRRNRGRRAVSLAVGVGSAASSGHVARLQSRRMSAHGDAMNNQPKRPASALHASVSMSALTPMSASDCPLAATSSSSSSSSSSSRSAPKRARAESVAVPRNEVDDPENPDENKHDEPIDGSDMGPPPPPSHGTRRRRSMQRQASSSSSSSSSSSMPPPTSRPRAPRRSGGQALVDSDVVRPNVAAGKAQSASPVVSSSVSPVGDQARSGNEPNKVVAKSGKEEIAEAPPSVPRGRSASRKRSRSQDVKKGERVTEEKKVEPRKQRPKRPRSVSDPLTDAKTSEESEEKEVAATSEVRRKAPKRKRTDDNASSSSIGASSSVGADNRLAPPPSSASSSSSSSGSGLGRRRSPRRSSRLAKVCH